MDTTTAAPEQPAVDHAQIGANTGDFDVDPGVWDIPDPWDEPDAFDDEALWTKQAASVGPAASLALGTRPGRSTCWVMRGARMRCWRGSSTARSA